MKDWESPWNLLYYSSDEGLGVPLDQHYSPDEGLGVPLEPALELRDLHDAIHLQDPCCLQQEVLAAVKGSNI